VDLLIFGLIPILMFAGSLIAIFALRLVMFGIRIAPGECGVTFFNGYPQKVLGPGTHMNFFGATVMRIRMDKPGWEQELDAVGNKFQNFHAQVEAFKASLRNDGGPSPPNL
jgi:hypothetical protein